ncbi:cell division protein ZapC [Pasteurellaceae bacterium 20609_3]|uniref:cell division protein ZapC domain-containing protein n=1 Tax=Spirabiliibacterium mucosae TaxID=28156 RepID=UPI001AAD2AB3|nr:cell division protein ZapC domain-containing protein [Spirabiliibacterium mucosae]MBE2898233.1 cell division protein ZapC [Spirabiliibacterium mucosae]
MNGFFYWEYSHVAQCLMLCSQDTGRRIRTSLEKSMLTQSALSVSDCDMEDFLFFNVVVDALKHHPAEDATREFLAYSAVAVRQFLLPIQPKSWFFTPLNGIEICDEAEPKLVQAQIKDSGEWVNLLLVQIGGNVADCLLLDRTLVLPGLNLTFAQPLRLFANRLRAMPIAVAEEHAPLAQQRA